MLQSCYKKIKGDAMNTFEAIFVRKSVRSYQHTELNSSILEDIQARFKEIKGLCEGTESELLILDNSKGQYKIFSVLGAKAPYYLALYSDEFDRCMMNAGYLMEQMSLYLCSIGLGSCFVGKPIVTKDLQIRGTKKLMLVLAFGKAQKSYIRDSGTANRMEVNKLCFFKEKPKYWMNQLLEVARLAPSSFNSQPWRFVVLDNCMHIYCKKQKLEYLRKWNEINFGILFSHMMVAADELWIDVDLIRLEEVTHKQFPNTEYVLSAVLRT